VGLIDGAVRRSSTVYILSVPTFVVFLISRYITKPRGFFLFIFRINISTKSFSSFGDLTQNGHVTVGKSNIDLLMSVLTEQ
jgi:hypothetical protein